MRSLPTILCCIVLAARTTALKKCDDCVKITDCAPALQLNRSDSSPAEMQQPQNAFCGFEDVQKVCCSDFISTQSVTEVNKNATQISEDEIDNHRNIHLLPAQCGDFEGSRILGGTSAGLYEFPWLVLISYRNRESLNFRCGGTVISAQYVLTAAHCVSHHDIAGVRVGEYDISQSEDCVGEGEKRECESQHQDISVTQAIHHPGFKTRPFVVNDIGLLRLATPVDFSYRNSGTICLPLKKYLRERDIVGETGVVAGWNLYPGANKSSILRKDMVPILSETACNAYFSPSRPDKINRMTKNICARDSDKTIGGGPLMLDEIYDGTNKFVQFGIMSYGSKTISSEKPVVYTDVRKYVKWILDTIEP